MPPMKKGAHLRGGCINNSPRHKRGQLLSLSFYLIVPYILSFKLCVFSFFRCTYLIVGVGTIGNSPIFPAGTTGRIARAYKGLITCPVTRTRRTSPPLIFNGLDVTRRSLRPITYKLLRPPTRSIRMDTRPFAAHIIKGGISLNFLIWL